MHIEAINNERHGQAEKIEVGQGGRLSRTAVTEVIDTDLHLIFDDTNTALQHKSSNT